jgi:hypothetical protein
MRAWLLTAVTLSAALCVEAVPQTAPKRKISCKIPQNASECYWTRGRIREGNGTPAYRMWKVGTKRLLGIYSGPSTYNDPLSLDNENPEFPVNVEKIWTSRLGAQLYGDFEVCPLALEHPGAMRPVCVESAKNLFVDRSAQCRTGFPVGACPQDSH